MYPSLKSGYRSKNWEINHGRNGRSQHTFQDKGAVDWTCNNFDVDGMELLGLIIKHTKYTRITLYNTFIHCDYKEVDSDLRSFYTSDSNSKWKFVKHI
jgi:hypothetical protein